MISAKTDMLHEYIRVQERFSQLVHVAVEFYNQCPFMHAAFL